MNETTLTRNVLIVVCAASAGVHAALAPAHVEESLVLGGGFAVAAVALVAVAFWLSAGPRRELLAADAATLLLLGLIVAYAVSRTVGLPIGGEGVERVDVTGAVTQVAQLVGLGAALLMRAAARSASARNLREEPTS